MESDFFPAKAVSRVIEKTSIFFKSNLYLQIVTVKGVGWYHLPCSLKPVISHGSSLWGLLNLEPHTSFSVLMQLHRKSVHGRILSHAFNLLFHQLSSSRVKYFGNKVIDISNPVWSIIVCYISELFFSVLWCSPRTSFSFLSFTPLIEMDSYRTLESKNGLISLLFLGKEKVVFCSLCAFHFPHVLQTFPPSGLGSESFLIPDTFSLVPSGSLCLILKIFNVRIGLGSSLSIIDRYFGLL